jgi:hypothetical protein
MNLLVRANTYDEFTEPQINFALVPLDPDYVAYLSITVQQAKAVEKVLKSLYWLDIADSSPIFFSWNDPMSEALDDKGWIITDRELDEEPVSLNVPGLLARPDGGLSWACHIKHTDVRAETYTIRLERLLEAFDIAKGER